MLKPSLHYPVSSVDKSKSALCRMSKMVAKVRLSTWDAPANTWTNEFATTWNYTGDPKATIEDLKQTVAGQMVLGKVIYFGFFLRILMRNHAESCLCVNIMTQH